MTPISNAAARKKIEELEYTIRKLQMQNKELKCELVRFCSNCKFYTPNGETTCLKHGIEIAPYSSCSDHKLRFSGVE